MNITVDNQEFEKTSDIRPRDGVWYNGSWYKPIPKFKEGDWVTFYSGTQGRKIIDRIKEWTSRSYCKLEEGLEPFKNIINKPTHNEIWTHLQQVATQKGLVKGAKVYKDWDGGSFVTIVQEDSNYYPETDEFAKSGIILYRKGKWVEKVKPIFKDLEGNDIYKGDAIYLVSDDFHLLYSSFAEQRDEKLRVFKTQEKAQEYINRRKPKTFTFGGYECSFQIVEGIDLIDCVNGTREKLKTVEVTCKETTGTHHEIKNILDHYEKPVRFGNVKLYKTYSLTGNVTVGCLQGNLQELKDIYNHCLNLLK